LPALFARSEANSKAVADFVDGSGVFDFLARDPATRSNTSICLKIVSPWFLSLDDAGRAKAARRMAALLEERGIAYDIGSYRDAPPGLRIWGGATVETSDIVALMPWCRWAHDVVASE
jgi:phosphoserine aminotransferase